MQAAELRGVEEEESGLLKAGTDRWAGHTGISANKVPCQPEMHNVEIGKLLKAFLSKNVMFCGGL